MIKLYLVRCCTTYEYIRIYLYMYLPCISAAALCCYTAVVAAATVLVLFVIVCRMELFVAVLHCI